MIRNCTDVGPVKWLIFQANPTLHTLNIPKYAIDT